MFKQTESPPKDMDDDLKVAAPARPSGSAPSIIGVDVKLTGNLATTGEVQIDGSIEGDLHCGSLTIGQTATIEGAVSAETVIVHGTLKGTIRAKVVRLEKSSKVIGDVLHEDLAIASGAHIEGRCARVANVLEDRTGVKAAASAKGLSVASSDEPAKAAG